MYGRVSFGEFFIKEMITDVYGRIQEYMVSTWVKYIRGNSPWGDYSEQLPRQRDANEDG